MIWVQFFLSEVRDDVSKGIFSWDLRVAHALWKLKNIPSLLIRISTKNDRYLITVKYIKVSQKWGSYGVIAIDLCHRIGEILKRIRQYDKDIVLYIHEWKALNSLLLLKCLSKGSDPVILQQHSTPNFLYRIVQARRAGKLHSELFYRMLSRWELKLLRSEAVKAIYPLNKLERRLYAEFLPDKIVRINTMGVFFPEEPPRKKVGDKISIAYVGPLVYNSWKGGDLIVKFFKGRGAQLLNKLRVVLAGPGDPALCNLAKKVGLECLGYLRNPDVLKLMREVDVLIWPVSRRVYWGGIGVTPIEAFASNTPVASPTLIHHEGNVSQLGWLLPWRENEVAVMDKLYHILLSLVEGGVDKEPYHEGKRFYDWQIIIDKMLSDVGR